MSCWLEDMVFNRVFRVDVLILIALFLSGVAFTSVCPDAD
jgi:hypothetical protein